VSGDQWRDEDVAHTLRLLEIIGRTDIPVVPGAAFPLIRTKEEVKRWEKLYGKVVYKGAWNENRWIPHRLSRTALAIMGRLKFPRCRREIPKPNQPTRTRRTSSSGC